MLPRFVSLAAAALAVAGLSALPAAPWRRGGASGQAGGAGTGPRGARDTRERAPAGRFSGERPLGAAARAVTGRIQPRRARRPTRGAAGDNRSGWWAGAVPGDGQVRG